MSTPREVLEELYKICDSIDKTPVGVKARMPDFSARESLRMSILTFITYLSTSDGKIDPEEARYFGRLLDFPENIYFMKETLNKINMEDIRADDYVPVILKIFVDFDNYCIKNNLPVLPASTCLIKLFAALGSDFLSCDGFQTYKEKVDLVGFIKKMSDYTKENFIDVQNEKNHISSNSLKAKYEILKKN